MKMASDRKVVNVEVIHFSEVYKITFWSVIIRSTVQFLELRKEARQKHSRTRNCSDMVDLGY